MGEIGSIFAAGFGIILRMPLGKSDFAFDITKEEEETHLLEEDFRLKEMASRAFLKKNILNDTLREFALIAGYWQKKAILLAEIAEKAA